MLNIKKLTEAVRLHESGMPQSQISGRIGVGKSTVGDWIRRAAALALSYEKLQSMGQFDLMQIWDKPTWLKSGLYFPDWAGILASISSRTDTIQTSYEKYLASCPKGSIAQSRSSFYREAKRQIANAPGELQELHMHNSFNPGTVAMIDYSGDGIDIRCAKGGKTTAQVFVGVLGFSGYIYCCATQRQTRSDWLRAIADMFHFFGGVTTELWLDNSTPLVKKADCTDPVLSPEFVNFCEQYGTDGFAVSPRKPTHKGLVENAVQQVQRRILAPLRSRQFFSLEELNKALAVKLAELNARPMTVRNHESRQTRFHREVPLLKALPPIEYQPSLKLCRRKVQKGNQIRLGNCRYNVPWGHVGSTLVIGINYATLAITYFEQDTGQRIGEAKLRGPGDGDEPMRREFVPKHLSRVLMSREELVQEVAEKFGMNAAALAATLAKQSNSRAVKHLTALISMGENYSIEEFDAICTEALNRPIVSYSALRQAKVAFDNSKKEKDSAQRTASIVPADKTTIRGAAYFNDEMRDDGVRNDK